MWKLVYFGVLVAVVMVTVFALGNEALASQTPAAKTEASDNDRPTDARPACCVIQDLTRFFGCGPATVNRMLCYALSTVTVKVCGDPPVVCDPR